MIGWAFWHVIQPFS